MTIPKHPLHAQFDEILAEIFEVKDNWYFSKINFVFIFFIANFLRYFFIDFKDQGQICNLLVMRIPKLTLIIEIDEELTEIFKVNPILAGGGHWMAPPSKIGFYASGNEFWVTPNGWQFLSTYIFEDSFCFWDKNDLENVLE